MIQVLSKGGQRTSDGEDGEDGDRMEQISMLEEGNDEKMRQLSERTARMKEVLCMQYTVQHRSLYRSYDFHVFCLYSFRP